MRPIRALGLAVVAMIAALPALAQPVTSPAPDSVAVTIYRAPNASPDRELQLNWLQGYALVTEKRTITIPRGRATIRFEGVAEGILPESAIVADLPSGVREKNLDADLLSPRSLYERSLGRPVTIRRRAQDGRQVEEPAIIRSGADGAAILETREGFVAVNCGPTRDSIVYPSVPAGLSAKPTLSIETESAEERRVTVTLSYLAWGFDWQANYVATMRPDGKLDLFAWVTLANTDVTSFVDAETMVVAGRLNRESARPYERPADGSLSFSCFPTFVEESEPQFAADGVVAEPMMMAPAPAPAMAREEIVVTGSRIARQEELGDLKLYRVPDPTTVASHSLKQVAMIDRKAVPVETFYRAYVSDGAQVRRVLRLQNRKEQGLGLPLPQGGVAVFAPRGEDRVLIGQGSVADKAVNEEVEIEIDDAPQIRIQADATGSGDRRADRLVTVTNANPFPVRFEGDVTLDDGHKRQRTSAKLHRKNGRDLWIVEVPANGSATLRYRDVAPRK
ncbi:hypothetical protein TPR58_18010 [Sphingomonas sp. HF-S3]|uniref:DUF4139 domain-containing protein n=1 Tax=Sphingomonas rustica TaxID=3103142 RepID=A0ABV0BC03_9SPHN